MGSATGSALVNTEGNPLRDTRRVHSKTKRMGIMVGFGNARCDSEDGVGFMGEAFEAICPFASKSSWS